MHKKIKDLQDEGYLTGKLLLATPSMRDPRFANAVIYICSHDENGAMGLVVNNTLPGMKFKHLMNELKLESDISVDPSILKTPLMNGGPVDTGRGFLMHGADFKVKESMTVDEKIYLSGTIESLQAVAQGEGPRDRLIMFGYAGWDAGQLNEEIQSNSWLITDADPELIFNTPNNKKWDLAVHAMGVNPALLSSDAGRA